MNAYHPACCSPLDTHNPLPNAPAGAQLISTRFTPDLLAGLRDQLITLVGPGAEVEQLVEILTQLKTLAASGTTVTEEMVEQVTTMVRANSADTSARMVTTCSLHQIC